jgi:hypothetical protein
VTATEVQVAHAAAAQRLGESAAADHMAAAQLLPGLGFQVALPSVPGPFGPPQGEGYNLPESTPALRRVAHVSAPPAYGSPLVAGLDHGGSVGFQTAREGVQVPGPPVYRYVSASEPRTPLLDRIRAALGVLLGRS